MSYKILWISLLLLPTLVGGGCFPDPPECVGSNPCPDGDGEVGEVDDSEAFIDVTLPDLELLDDADLGDGTEEPDEASSVEVDVDADETSEDGDTGGDADTAEATAELPEAETTDTDVEAEAEVQMDAEVESELGPEIEYKECDDLECELEFRECIEGMAATDARCGDCLEDYKLSGGECVAILTCADLACGAAHRDCTERTGDIDASCGNCQAGYRLSAGVCVAVLTCNDLICEMDNRDCTEGSGTIDAVCSNCLPGYSLVGSECLASAPAPTGVSATTANEADVVITWQGVENANGYDVYRCDLASCGSGAAGWFVLNDVPVLDLTYIDDTVSIPALPNAPGNMSASTNDGTKVTLSWSSVSVPEAKSYRYRVVAVSDAGDSPASQAVPGQVANRPVTGYELAIDGGAWTNIGLVTTRDDVDAPAPSITPSTASASQGAYEGFVRLSATAASVTNGGTRQYAIRATTARGPGPSATASGSRPAGSLTLQWERSSGSNAENFSPINGATALSYDDTGAPADGATRWYRLVASASGAGSQPSNPVAGSRLNPASLVPTGVSASNTRPSDVEVRWNTVSGATGYSVYRCDLANCSGGGWNLLNASPTTSTSYIDTTVEVPAAPAAPTVTATTDRTDNVIVSWNTVSVANAKSYTYRVVAQSGTGPSAPSSHVVGSVIERPVTGYEYQIDGGGWSFSSTTQVTDTNAPAATLTTPNAAATQGTVAGQVNLTSEGSTNTPGANRSYQVRATTVIGPGAVGAATGRRVSTGLQYQWQRSASTTNSNFANITGATSANAADTLATGANPSGATRYYRLQVSATGASTVVSNAVVGTVLAAPTAAPSGFEATTNRSDYVELKWTPVAGATEYRIFRDGAQIATSTSAPGGDGKIPYQDSGITKPAPWAAPSLAAAINTPTHVQLDWTIQQTPPSDSSADYSVVAANAAGAGPAKNVTGKLVPYPVTGFMLEHITNGVTATAQISGASTRTYNHVSPPGSIGGTLTATATQGDHRAHVKLTANESGISANSGTVVTFRVAIVTAAGAGTYSSPVNGERIVGPVTLDWQSASSLAGPYTSLTSSTATPFNDATAPANGTHRYYKRRASASGAADIVSAGTEGWRVSFAAVTASGFIGFGFSCALTDFSTDGGRVWCWGSNNSGQMGIGTTSTSESPNRIPGLATARQLTSLSGAACVRRDNMTVACWGNNDDGELGDGTKTERSSPVNVAGLSATFIAGGTTSACAINTQGGVVCWGANGFGQLGNGSNVGSSTPVSVVDQNGNIITSASWVASGAHSCAVRSGGSVWCWGWKTYGQLGEPPGMSPPSLDDYRAHAKQVAGISGATEVSTESWGHSCALLGASGARCWGLNQNGQLGNSSTTDSNTPVVVVGLTGASKLGGRTFGSFAIAGGAALGWGSNLGLDSTAPTGWPVLTSGVTDLSVGSTHACAIMNGDVYCWGENEDGELGDGTRADRNQPTKMVGP